MLDDGGGMAKRRGRAPVSVWALMQRINRILAPEREKLKRQRRDRWRADLGGYYIIDVDSNAILYKHVDREGLGGELDALGEWERLAGE